MPASETLSSRRFDEIIDTFPAGEVPHLTCPALSFADEYPARLVDVDPDPDPLMPESIRKLAAERPVTVETARATTEELPFPDASFDPVVSRLHPRHFQDWLLRPGGRLRRAALGVLTGHGGRPESRTGVLVKRWSVIGVKPLGGGTPTCR